MKLSAFEKVIRKIMREEIDFALKRELKSLKEEINQQKPYNQQKMVESPNDNELETFRAKLRSQIPPPNFNTGNDTFNSLLTETAMSPTSEDIFEMNDPVNEFVNRDYSQLMKAIDGKKEYRP